MTVLVLGLALVAFAIAGLAVDGTRAFLLRRSLQNSADAAAIAAASELDTDSYYATSGRVVRLDAEGARLVATRFILDRGLDARSQVHIERESVTVILRGRLPTSFLGLVGIDAVPVAVEARAAPIPGSTSPR